MIVSVQSDEHLSMVALPAEVGGAHWIVDRRGTRVAFVEGTDAAWSLEPADGLGVRGLDAARSQPVRIDPARLSVINVDEPGGASWCLVFQPADIGALETRTYGFAGNITITVGRSADNTIVYASTFVSGHHARLTYREGVWSVADLRSANGVFVNGCRLASGKETRAEFGDVISVLGLNITLGAGLVSYNNPGAAVRLRDESAFVPYHVPQGRRASASKVAERASFYPALRFARTIERRTFTVDAPPAREREEKTTLIQRIGPSLLMGGASMMSASVSVMTMMQQGNVLQAVPMVAMAAAMLGGSVAWPAVNARHQRREREHAEAVRRGSYSQYLSGVLSELAQEEELQRSILRENRVSVHQCLEMAARGDAHLMDRTFLHDDYLELRIGRGEEPLVADIHFPERHFTVEQDELREAVDAQAGVARTLADVPLALSLLEKNVVGIIGNSDDIHAFARGLVVQLASLCSYEDVKIVVLADEDQRDEWAFAAHLPHAFSDDRRMRYFACGMEEAGEVGMFLERILEERGTKGSYEPRTAHPYYVVVCASEAIADKAAVIRAIASSSNRGVSLVALAGEMKDLPKECRSVLGVSTRMAYLLDRDDPRGERREFTPDVFVSREEAERLAFHLSKLRLDLEVERQRIPSHLGFLEMQGAGSVEHLSIASRWEASNASASLACVVGVDALGEPVLLNLHEKHHGPHGLIAGTTGSGKSEFIITYILSMALTYSPDDVAFVLIDYKGGGLAKAFDNEHVRLPHLAGVITNLDGSAISRSLVSIQSELKRRQALFNKARDVVGGDNIDIYDYLDLFRQGRMSEPCPHLFIVADEFAELKDQQPEFMDELISAARIGRSLGVHLILATQKPSGVVNDQIWSNARFKVCLKVADESDSKEMIRRPDAAALQEAGRFYLLVGYNEYFTLGQSGYAGTRYVAHDRLVSAKDDSVTLISDTGSSLVSVKPRKDGQAGDGRPESVVVLAAIRDAAESAHLRARQLWLEPIPAVITADALAAKYGRPFAEPRLDFTLDPIIGEYDDPSRQFQGLLTLPLTREGNALLYGTTDSGVETALFSLMYSLVRTHDAQSLNVYALDFGSEALRAFAAAPQVGDVIGVADAERLTRLLDFFDAELARRRALMAHYGGSFERYTRDHHDLPAIVVVINDLAAVVESYPKLEERLQHFVRETGRYGVFLVATASDSSSVRLRMRQSFRQLAAINLADQMEYGMILGSVRDVVLPKGFGRGLVQREDGIFEFQAAHLTAEGDDYGFASAYCADLAEAAEVMGAVFAPPIPTAPEVVPPELLLEGPLSASLVPFGIHDDDLSVAGFDFADVPLARCLFQRRKDGAAFARSLLSVATRLAGWQVALLDMAQLMGDATSTACIIATDDAEAAGQFLANLVDSADREAAGQSSTLLILTGITDLFNVLDYELSARVRSYLQGLRTTGGVFVLLLDAATDVTYTYEDWFKAHLTNKDGLWVGPGIDAQTAISVTYNAQLATDAGMDATRGYESDGGIVRLVHLVSDKEKDNSKDKDAGW